VNFTIAGTKPNFRRLSILIEDYVQAFGLKINWPKSLAYWISPKHAPPWLAHIAYPLAIERQISKLLDSPFGLELHTPDIDKFLGAKVRKKLK
jgi:hypothetical protein